jgi:hypothetical protein
MMYLHKDDLKKMLEVLESFPNIEVLKVDQDTSSGIGAVTTVSFDTVVNDWNSQVTIEISGVENW